MKSAKKKIIDSKIHIKNYLPLIFFSRYISQRKPVSRHNILSFQTRKKNGERGIFKRLDGNRCKITIQLSQGNCAEIHM